MRTQIDTLKYLFCLFMPPSNYIGKLCVQSPQIILAPLDGRLASLWLFQYLHPVSSSFSSSAKDLLSWEKKKNPHSTTERTSLGEFLLSRQKVDRKNGADAGLVCQTIRLLGSDRAMGQAARDRISPLLGTGCVISDVTSPLCISETLFLIS